MKWQCSEVTWNHLTATVWFCLFGLYASTATKFATYIRFCKKKLFRSCMHSMVGYTGTQWKKNSRTIASYEVTCVLIIFYSLKTTARLFFLDIPNELVVQTRLPYRKLFQTWCGYMENTMVDTKNGSTEWMRCRRRCSCRILTKQNMYIEQHTARRTHIAMTETKIYNLFLLHFIWRKKRRTQSMDFEHLSCGIVSGNLPCHKL